MEVDTITRQIEWIKSRNLGGNDQLLKMMRFIDSLEAENAQLKADIDAYKTTIAGYVKDEELYRLEIKALISVRGQMERGVDIMAAEINQLKAELAEAKARGARLREALRALHALVKGECPSLLREDSGGDAELDLKIEVALKEADA